MNKFYDFKNQTETSIDLYIYGAITTHKTDDIFSSESDIDLDDFKEKLDTLNYGSTLNMFINSPGGSVFAASTMISMLQRQKDTKNIKINAYVDGLAASAASLLIMVADEINMYSNSMIMIHKPLSFVYGNAEDMQKEIEVLNKIETGIMYPLYEKKAKCDLETIKNLINAESWLSAKEVDSFFNVNLLDEEKDTKACIDSELFKCYKNVPNSFKNNANDIEKEKEEPKQHENVDSQSIDYTYFENILSSMKGDKK